ncbi:MAG: SIMPL domain-containing protein [Planctomycetota bacterium]|jgi:uncharacterized protein YggE
MRLAPFFFMASLVFVTVRPGLAEENAIRAVTVSGTGTVESPPDQVVLTISVTTEGSDLLETRRESDSELQAILKLGEAHGVRPDGFRVTELMISYGFDEDRRRFFYRVDREANMTLKEIARFDALLAAALKRGGLNITGIVFGTSNGQALEAEARRRAVAVARAKAEQLAKLNGLKLGMARVISEDQFSQQPFVISAVPVVGMQNPRRPRRAGNAQPGGGFFSIADGKSQRTSQVPVKPAGFAQARASGDDVAPPQAVAAGLGVIETNATVTIEFELKAP